MLALVTVPASAHDPGQGPKLGEARLEAHVSGHHVDFAGQLLQECRLYTPERLAARRAGVTLYAPLRRSGRCGFAGSINLEERGRGRGRWFVYAELRHRREGRAETWELVDVAHHGSQHVENTRLVYRPPSRDAASTVKVASSVVMFAVIIALLIMVLVLARRFDASSQAGATAR
jgi:hypothetical protein